MMMMIMTIILRQGLAQADLELEILLPHPQKC